MTLPFISAMMLGGGVLNLPTSANWTLVEARDCSASPAANQDFTNLGGYDELIVVMQGVTCSGASNRRLFFSTDNGVSFFSGSTDYNTIDGDGVNGPSAAELFYSTTFGTGAQYTFTHIPCLVGSQKLSLTAQQAGSNYRRFHGSVDRVNAVRLTSATADTLNGGTIYVYARTAAWSLIGSNTSPAASDIDFTGLSSYDELLLIMDGVTASSAANRRVRYSVDNGSSFYAGASDYQREHAITGVNTNWSEAQLLAVDAIAARSMIHRLLNTTGPVKAGLSLGGRESDSAHNPGHYFKASASDIDALRLTTGTAATLNGGAVYLYGRAKPWTLVESRSCAGAAAVNQDFLSLSGYEELLIVIDAVGSSGSSSRNLELSVDNGSTWFNTAGDYFSLFTVACAKTDSDTAATLSAQSSAARSMVIHIPMTTGAVKPILHTGNNRFNLFVGSTSQVNAIRVTSDTAFTLNSGTISVFGR